MTGVEKGDGLKKNKQIRLDENGSAHAIPQICVYDCLALLNGQMRKVFL